MAIVTFLFCITIYSVCYILGIQEDLKKTRYYSILSETKVTQVVKVNTRFN